MTDALKPALRRQFRGARRDFVAGLSMADRQRLESALAAFVAPLLAHAACPASYAACGNEIDPRIIETDGATFAFPRVSPDGLTFHQCHWSDLRPGHAGILEPPVGTPHVTPGVLLVPLVAVTSAGLRLGQGQGHYDRTLAALRCAGPVRTIGLAWDVQLADALPHDAWDIPLDHVATPTRLFDCARLR